MRQISFLFAWWLSATLLVIISAITLQEWWRFNSERVVLSVDDDSTYLSSNSGQSSVPTYGQVQGIETTTAYGDARPALVANFLERHNSPLEPYDHFGKVFVELADKYNIDFRLLPAIAMQESNLCKKIPPGSYNCLGFGIHERGTLTFESFEANFDRAARELKKYYIDQGRTTPEDIMRKYTPSSNGSWANSVNQWIAEMNYDDRALGREKKENANLLEWVDNSQAASAAASPKP